MERTLALLLANVVAVKVKLFKSNVFHYTTLKTSYRITHQMADFINVAMLDETRLVAQKYGPGISWPKELSLASK